MYTIRNAQKNAISTTVVLGTVKRVVETANERRKRIASTSASDTVPAKFQWIFSNVTQKRLAREKKLVTRLTPAPRERRCRARPSSRARLRLTPTAWRSSSPGEAPDGRVPHT